MKNKLKSILLVGTPVIIALLFSALIQATFLKNPQRYIDFFSSWGPLFILVYAVFQTLTIIIAPIGGFVPFVILLAIAGPFC